MKKDVKKYIIIPILFSKLNLNTMVLKKKEVENSEDVQTGRKTDDNYKSKF